MIRSELVKTIVDKYEGLPPKQVTQAVLSILDTMSNALAQGQRIEIRGFGSFEVRMRPAREGRNPSTGEKVLVPSKYAPHFKPGKDLRTRLKAKVELKSASPAKAKPKAKKK